MVTNQNTIPKSCFKDQRIDDTTTFFLNLLCLFYCLFLCEQNVQVGHQPDVLSESPVVWCIWRLHSSHQTNEIYPKCTLIHDPNTYGKCSIDNNTYPVQCDPSDTSSSYRCHFFYHDLSSSFPLHSFTQSPPPFFLTTPCAVYVIGHKKHCKMSAQGRHIQTPADIL